jgi:cyanate permease
MKLNRFKNPLILAHIAGLVLSLPLTVFLALTYAYRELAHYQSITMAVFILLYLVTNIFAALAFRKIGQSPLFAFTALVMGLIPLILYAVLPDKSPASA